MMPWEDVRFNSSTRRRSRADYMDAHLHGLIRGADLALLMVDLGSDDGIEQCQEVLDRLAATKTRLAAASFLDENDVGLSYTPHLPGAQQDRPARGRRPAGAAARALPAGFHGVRHLGRGGTGLERLRDAIYAALDVIRVYSKLPTAKEPDRDRPFTSAAGVRAGFGRAGAQGFSSRA